MKIPEALLAILNAQDSAGRKEQPITAENISDFENKVGATLPNDYKDYCIKYGARSLDDTDIFTFKGVALDKSGRKKKIDIGKISGPPYIQESYDMFMDERRNDFAPQLPKGFYPFTFDSGYGSCLLNLTDQPSGKILYLSVKRKIFGSPDYGWDDVLFVADSFSEFIESLKPEYL